MVNTAAQKNKGVSPLLGAVMLVMIALTMAAMLTQWSVDFFSGETGEIESETESRLRCQRAELYIKAVTYDCNIICEGGSGYCSGLPLDCIFHNASETNCTISGCGWVDSFCSGTADPCITHNTSQVNCTTSLCSWETEHCEGNVYSCSYYGDSQNCTTAGCSWNPSSCSNNGNCNAAGNCNNCPGCSPSSGGYCSNKAGGSCPSCTDQVNCTNCSSAGCSWGTGTTTSVIFLDGFEDGISWTNWTETGSGSWLNSQTGECNPAVGCFIPDGWCACSELASTDDLTQKNAMDLTTYTDCILNYAAFVDSGLDNGEYFYVDVWNSGDTWTNIFSCTNGQACEDDTWHAFVYNITSGVGLLNDFRVRFRASGNDNNEELFIDAINITCRKSGTSTCSGTLNCAAYATEGACTACSQCQWTPTTTCTGTLNCPTYDSNQAACQACDQCSWNPESCTGTPNACSTYGMPATCEQRNCTWIPDNCTGVPGSCGLHNYSETNCTITGCGWNPADCIGSPDSCGSYTSQSNCTIAGCDWSGDPGNCTEPDHHNITYDISNMGLISISIDKIFVKNTTGYLYNYDLTKTELLPEDNLILIVENQNKTLNRTIDDITIESINCPDTARDVYPGEDVSYINC